MLETREIDFFNLSAVLALEISKSQAGYVAPNAVTIAQNAYEPAGWLRGLWDGDTPVGLIAMVNPTIKSPSFEEGDLKDAAYLWRLMIDENHQRKGYGKQAMEIAFAQAREWQHPKLQTSCVPGAFTPQPFYERLGMVATGRIIDDEVELICDVPLAR